MNALSAEATLAFRRIAQDPHHVKRIPRPVLIEIARGLLAHRRLIGPFGADGEPPDKALKPEGPDFTFDVWSRVYDEILDKLSVRDAMSMRQLARAFRNPLLGEGLERFLQTRVGQLKDFMNKSLQKTALEGRSELILRKCLPFLYYNKTVYQTFLEPISEAVRNLEHQQRTLFFLDDFYTATKTAGLKMVDYKDVRFDRKAHGHTGSDSKLQEEMKLGMILEPNFLHRGTSSDVTAAQTLSDPPAFYLLSLFNYRTGKLGMKKGLQIFIDPDPTGEALSETGNCAIFKLGNEVWTSALDKDYDTVLHHLLRGIPSDYDFIFETKHDKKENFFWLAYQSPQLDQVFPGKIKRTGIANNKYRIDCQIFPGKSNPYKIFGSTREGLRFEEHPRTLKFFKNEMPTFIYWGE